MTPVYNAPVQNNRLIVKQLSAFEYEKPTTPNGNAMLVALLAKGSVNLLSKYADEPKVSNESDWRIELLQVSLFDLPYPYDDSILTVGATNLNTNRFFVWLLKFDTLKKSLEVGRFLHNDPQKLQHLHQRLDKEPISDEFRKVVQERYKVQLWNLEPTQA